MTRDRCERTWQVEALEDGRLEDKDRASLERHLATCAVCDRAREELAALRRVLRDLPVSTPSELDRRRGRAALLARANDEVVAPKRPMFRIAPALVAVAVVVATVVLLLARRSPSATDGAGPRFEVLDVAQADYTTARDGATASVVLRSGTASFHVERVGADARFLVKVPDGEVEVRGTRFVVTVSEGRTRSVVVTEGTVDVRVAGHHGLVHAGERWPANDRAAAAIPDGTAGPSRASTPDVPPAPPPSAPATAVVSSPPPPAPVVASASSPLPPSPSHAPVPAGSVATPVAAGSIAAPLASSSAAPALASPGARFAEAMSAYGAGDYGGSERFFSAFVRDFSNDARAEDAMFLIADGRARRGDEAGARAAARAYLQRYPDGLRAPAARRLAGAP